MVAIFYVAIQDTEPVDKRVTLDSGTAPEKVWAPGGLCEIKQSEDGREFTT